MVDGKWLMGKVISGQCVQDAKKVKETSVNYSYVTCSSLIHLNHS
jgi:hypothetical protein